MNLRRIRDRPTARTAAPPSGHPANAGETAAIFRQALLLAVLVAIAAVASPLGA